MDNYNPAYLCLNFHTNCYDKNQPKSCFTFDCNKTLQVEGEVEVTGVVRKTENVRILCLSVCLHMCVCVCVYFCVYTLFFFRGQRLVLGMTHQQISGFTEISTPWRSY